MINLRAIGLGLFIFIQSCILHDEKKKFTSNQHVPHDENIDSLKSNANKIKETEEDFKPFFEKFKRDSIFQLERKKNPLVLKALSDDGASFEYSSIDKFTSKFYRFKKKSNFSQIKLSNTCMVIQETINDTGIDVEFYFNIHSKLWYLDSIIDNSW